MRSVKYLQVAIFVLVTTLIVSFTKKTNSRPTAGGPEVTEPGLRILTIVNNYEVIWGMDFLPDGDMLFTEKKGKLHRYHAGKVTDISGMPEVNTNGQGGLLDIKVHPSYASNGWIYITYAAFDINKKGILTLARFKLKSDAVTNMETLLKASTPDLWFGHYGSRIAFDRQGFLYVSIGEGGPTSYGGSKSPNMNAQNVKAEWGKIHRLKDNGQVPADNPILPGNTVPTTVYSYGHRNPQGLAWNPFTNELWENEHGPRGGDEVNIIRKGRNYGWPLVSYGINYDGKPVSSSPAMDGIEMPIHTWTPSIAPCGMAFVNSNKFKSWKGQMLVGSLAFTHLTRCEFANGKLVKETKMLNGVGRVRNVKQGPDGNIYVSVENPGRILQLMPE